MVVTHPQNEKRRLYNKSLKSEIFTRSKKVRVKKVVSMAGVTAMAWGRGGGGAAWKPVSLRRRHMASQPRCAWDGSIRAWRGVAVCDESPLGRTGGVPWLRCRDRVWVESVREESETC